MGCLWGRSMPREFLIPLAVLLLLFFSLYAVAGLVSFGVSTLRVEENRRRFLALVGMVALAGLVELARGKKAVKVAKTRRVVCWRWDVGRWDIAAWCG